MRWQVIQGDCIAGLKTLADASVHCCVTSPPYWGLRDYGHTGQIGLEETPGAYVARMVEVFGEVRRVLRDDGTLWLNLGDSYATSNPVGRRDCIPGALRERRQEPPGSFTVNARKWRPGAWATEKVDERGQRNRNGVGAVDGLKAKDLVGIPWRVAFALQADGWYLRQDIIWHKPNPMPESVTDRCTKAHEYIFLLSKSQRYHYDAQAIAEDAKHAGVVVKASNPESAKNAGKGRYGATSLGFTQHDTVVGDKRNRRSVWTINPQPCHEAHFAVMPEELAELCICAGCPEDGVVLDPFTGSGTTGIVALRHQRHFIGTELNAEYCEMARRRIASSMPLYAVEGSIQ